MEQHLMECDVMHACTFMYVYEPLKTLDNTDIWYACICMKKANKHK